LKNAIFVANLVENFRDDASSQGATLKNTRFSGLEVL
jgi:hypothetical protein